MKRKSRDFRRQEDMIIAAIDRHRRGLQPITINAGCIEHPGSAIGFWLYEIATFRLDRGLQAGRSLELLQSWV